jgi:citrate synthase
MVEGPTEQDLIDVAGAAERLGVKPETIYAYVSRGLLRRLQSDDSRRSLLYAAEVEGLARKGKPRHRAGAFELAIESAVTALGPDRPYFRGLDALELAGRNSFESVAEWLWAGTWRDAAALSNLWRPNEPAVAAARAAQAQLPASAPPIDRLQVTISVLSATDPVRFQLDPAAVIATARRLIPSLVDALPPVTRSTRKGPGGSLAQRLWPKLSPRSPIPKLVAALDAALVLLADHELAASTLAARVAASVRADPYAVVAAGLGVLVGPMHGGASLGVERLLRSIRTPEAAAAVLGDHLRRDERIPGIGHAVYKNGDGRATRLLRIVEDASAGNERLAVAHAVLAELRARQLSEINIDFAVATLVDVAGMLEGSAQAIFAVARTAGWIAHALEEYQGRKPLRPRTIYTGPPIPARRDGPGPQHQQESHQDI